MNIFVYIISGSVCMICASFIMESNYATTIVLLISFLVIYITYVAMYWRRKNVPYTFSYRNTLSVNFLQKSYDYFKSRGHKFYGIVIGISPCFIVTDIELIKNVLHKDFQHFNHHGIYVNHKKEPLTGHLFNLQGEEWKKMRIKLTPTFTSGKIKMMFPILLSCSKQMRDFVNIASKNNDAIDIKNVSACFTTDVIGSCAFGLDCNSFSENDDFRKHGKMIFRANAIDGLKRLILLTSSKLAKFSNIQIIDKEVENFFMGTLRKTVEYREKNDYRRNDFLQLLIDMKIDKNALDSADGNNSLTFEQLAAQSFLFFVAGFDTSSSVMSFCLYELGMNQKIQDKVRSEINEVLKKHDGQITYEAIMDMKYLHQAIEETLRKYPVLPILFRDCTANYKIPNTDIVLEKGTKVFIPMYQIQNDEEFFPNPTEFNPDRFSPENKANIKPYTYLPFGEGPRICIGLRFGLVQVKIGLVTILKDFKIYLDQSCKTPMKFDPHSFGLKTKENILLKAEKLSTS